MNCLNCNRPRGACFCGYELRMAGMIVVLAVLGGLALATAARSAEPAGLTFNVFKSEKNGQFYFNLKARNNAIIAQSEGYKHKADAIHAIELIRSGASSATIKGVSDATTDPVRRLPNQRPDGVRQLVACDCDQRAAGHGRWLRCRNRLTQVGRQNRH